MSTPITTMKARPEFVTKLVDELCTALDTVPGVEPIEVVQAGLSFATRAMKLLVRHSSDHETKMLNEAMLLRALDGMKLAVVDEHDPLQVN
jgi:hypothetical protein